MDRRTFVKGSAAVVGAATLPTVYAQAQAAPDKIRFGYAITQSGPLGPGAEFDQRVAIQAVAEARERRRRHHAEEVQQEGAGRPGRL